MSDSPKPAPLLPPACPCCSQVGWHEASGCQTCEAYITERAVACVNVLLDLQAIPPKDSKLVSKWLNRRASGEHEVRPAPGQKELGESKKNQQHSNSTVGALPIQLPMWFPMFLRNVCEIPDRNSPDDEPDAIVATLGELRTCARSAIDEWWGRGAPERHQSTDDPSSSAGAADGQSEPNLSASPGAAAGRAAPEGAALSPDRSAGGEPGSPA